MPPDRSPGDPGPASTVELVQTAVSQISTLVRDELALAKTEIISKGKNIGLGSGLVGVAGALALYGIGLVLALVVTALAIVWPVWLSLLVVTVAVFAAAAAVGLAGKRKISSAAPPVPTGAVGSVQDDLRAVTDAFREGRGQ